MMPNRFILLIFLCSFPLPVAAEEEGEGRDLMGEALRLFMRGLVQEMEPAFTDLSGLLGRLDAYHPPEVLPNGDIIIRRKKEFETLEGQDGEVDL